MNKIQALVLEELVSRVCVQNMVHIPIALLEALDCDDFDIEDGILEVLKQGKYIQPHDMKLSVQSIENILEYAEEVDLDLELGFESVLNSYVVSKIGEVIEVDLLELM